MEKIIDEFLNYKDDDNNNTRTSYSGDLILFSNFLRKKNITSFYVVTPKIIEDFYTSNFLDNYERIWKNNGKVRLWRRNIAEPWGHRRFFLQVRMEDMMLDTEKFAWSFSLNDACDESVSDLAGEIELVLNDTQNTLQKRQ